ncbi:WGR domain-containing protein [Leptospira interrogans]|uniref:WGR domain-containing protein n=1 Tax=Leptospira interrogans TaxID=173 RepID=UPI0002BC10CD|nr:WGR domain-containing protein [Leptospira interrogans]AKH78004.1 ATP-dependent DNA ligase [Leptospira interrogans serovar Bratislava]KLO77121.1 ATP-dependent DNA ligase-like domain protein [Leptospira interrogans serovar Muenchen]KWV26713.1 ATP-dependent DNA ligase [Leptospira interrogans]KWV28886.1 ATP-dependent DNA ligase [Leptospira interrogans]
MNHKLIFRDDKSDKFWNIETSGNSFTVTYGKTGTAGTSQTKTFETEETCIKEARKLLSEKLKKGYIEGNDRTEKLTSNNDKKHKSNQQEVNKIIISKSEKKTKSAPQKVIEESENEIKQSSQTSANKKENLKQNPQTQEQNSNPLSENSTELNKISLYYQGDGSDKVYHVNIDPEGDGYVVHFAFGRRGSSLQTGTKTSKPVSYEAAQKIMRQLVNSKMAKGYTEIESGAPYLHSTKEERVSGVHCQLLNPIDEEELSTYVEDDQYGAQEKLDGNRMMIRKIGDNVEGINRKGLIIAISQILHDHSLSFSEDFILDGEVIGDVFFPFDIFSKDGKDIQHLPYQERYAILESILKDQDEIFHIVKLVKSTKGKKVLLEELREKQKEGIVFKDLNAPYKAGRPSSKGSQIKFKFYETATVSVETVNLKRSVSMRLYNGNEWVSVGNVTIPINFAIPKENDIIEVRYLYAYKGGSLYQPTYLGARTDADENDCDLKQLKYKNA